MLLFFVGYVTGAVCAAICFVIAAVTVLLEDEEEKD